MELDDLSFEILDLVLFPEEFGSIVSECKSTRNANVIADVIKDLIHKKLVVPGSPNEKGDFVPGGMYNTDSMSDYMYVATSKGVEIMKSARK